MDYSNLLSIGDLASICNVSHKTLRHYDSIGILKPTVVNKENGYRYYSKWQISRITTIKELQSLGISLAEINLSLESCDNNLLIDSLKELLEIRELDIKTQIITLHKDLEKIKSFKSQHEEIKKILLPNGKPELIVKKIPNRKMICKMYTGRYNAEVFRLYYKELLETFRKKGSFIPSNPTFPMAIYSQMSDLNNVDIKIGFETSSETCSNEFIIEYIPEAYYVSYIYKGNYSSLRNDGYIILYQYIKDSGYVMAGPIIEIYYISENIVMEQNYFITEIQVQIKKI